MFSGRKAIVTGGSRGIGEAIARQLLANGCHVTITATSDRLGWWTDIDACELIPCNFSDEEQVISLCKHLEQEGYDYLVNNAGMFLSSSFEEQSDFESWEKMQLINVQVPMMLTVAVTRGMKESGFGRIVNISSIASIVTRSGLAAYSASKAALSSLTRTTAIEYAGDNILINAVCPAYTDTEMLKNLDEQSRMALLEKVPLKRFGKPEDVSEMVIFLLSDKNNFITGQNLILDGGVTIQ